MLSINLSNQANTVVKVNNALEALEKNEKMAFDEKYIEQELLFANIKTKGEALGYFDLSELEIELLEDIMKPSFVKKYKPEDFFIIKSDSKEDQLIVISLNDIFAKSKVGHGWTMRDRTTYAKTNEMKFYNWSRVVNLIKIGKVLQSFDFKKTSITTENIEDYMKYLSIPSYASRKGYTYLQNRHVNIAKYVHSEMVRDNNIFNITIKQTNEQDATQTRTQAASVFETKKTISAKIRKLMKNSPLLTSFPFVEIDNSMDLNHYDNICEGWDEVQAHLPKLDNMPTIRFRKLGRSNALGQYSPNYHTIIVSTSNARSLIHEYAHALDYKLVKIGEKMSSKPEFQAVVKRYKELYNQSVANNTDMLNHRHYLINRRYYTSDVEVFANAFEYYLYKKLNIDNNYAFHSRESFETSNQFKIMEDETFKELINDYFDVLCAKETKSLMTA